MSSYFTVHLRCPTAPEHLIEAHAEDTIFLNARGRPCEANRAAKLESAALAEAMLAACDAPLRERYGAELVMTVRAGDEAGNHAERVASDSNAVRDWLAAQQQG